jgi:glycosyltransferase involved in cell wall biosynthesis
MRIVWHCADRVGSEMAGPGIRAVELSRRLGQRHDVTLVAPGAATLPEDGGFARAEPDALLAALRGADAFVTQGFDFPLRSLLRFRGRLVLDLYDPVLLEQLAQFGQAPTPAQRVSLAHVRARLLVLLRRADHVLCASPDQRVFWLGWLGAAGRLAPGTLAGDPEARRLVAVVPFGMPETPPRRDGQPLRAAVGAADGERVALFWGGMWDWMDPALAVRAAGLLAARRVPIHLALLAGTRPGGATMRAAADEARRAAMELRLERRVHFLDRWIPYAERGAVLLDADVAVTAHKPSLEAELAFRTRLLDCLWARLPAACTRGDALAAEAERAGWGAAADAGDAEGLAHAIASLLEPPANARARAAAAAAAEHYRWSRSADAVLALLDAPSPPRPHALVPGEVAGERIGRVARALGAKVIGRLRK